MAEDRGSVAVGVPGSALPTTNTVNGFVLENLANQLRGNCSILTSVVIIANQLPTIVPAKFRGIVYHKAREKNQDKRRGRMGSCANGIFAIFFFIFLKDKHREKRRCNRRDIFR